MADMVARVCEEKGYCGRALRRATERFSHARCLGPLAKPLAWERDVTAHGSSAKLIRQLIAGSQVSRSEGERSARPSDAQSASVEAAGDCGLAAPRTTGPTRRDFPQFSRWLVSLRWRCLQFATLSARGLKALVTWFWFEAQREIPLLSHCDEVEWRSG